MRGMKKRKMVVVIDSREVNKKIRMGRENVVQKKMLMEQVGPTVTLIVIPWHPSRVKLIPVMVVAPQTQTRV